MSYLHIFHTVTRSERVLIATISPPRCCVVAAVISVEYVVGVVLVDVDALLMEGVAAEVEGLACEAIECDHVVSANPMSTNLFAGIVRACSDFH